MANKNTRNSDQQQANKHSDLSSPQSVGDSVAPLVERAEPQEVNYKTRYQDEPPQFPVFRWLWKYSQVILSALTFLVLVVYGAQWWQARETRELENRAYVIVKGVGLRQMADNPGMSDIVITVTNTGKTPGLNGTTLARLEGRENPIPDDAGFPPLDTPPSRTVLAPQIDSELTLGPILNRAGEEAAKQASAKQESERTAALQKANPKAAPAPSPAQTPPPQEAKLKFIYVYGVISYEDVFGRLHQTRFCYFNTPGTLGWNGCPAFNSFN